MSDSRPLRQSSIEQLEGIARSAGEHHHILELIIAELGHRDSVSAQRLRDQLTAGLGSSAAARDSDVPTATTFGATTTRDFIQRILERHGLSAPSGFPLYRYQARAADLAELRPILSRSLKQGDRGQATAMAFCIWAAEWWRRNHAGGAWKWENLLNDLECPEFGPGERYYNQLLDLVILGLRGWKRDLLSVGASRGFLVTLAVEGGLPMLLVLREQAHLRAYLKGVLEEFTLFGNSGVPPQDLAERVRDRLPLSLRQKVVYQLAADLIQQIRVLQQKIGDTSTPVRALDAAHPGWRDELPVRVTDEVARILLNNLLLDAAEIARGGRIRLRWNVQVTPVGAADWEMSGVFHIPTALSRADFNLVFGREAEAAVPARFDLCVQVEDAPLQVLAIGRDRQGESGNRHLRLELMPAALSEYSQKLERARTLLVRTRDEILETDFFPGAGGLSDLPWVFVPDDPTEHGRDACRLVGQGSMRLREPWAFVIVSADHSVSDANDGDIEIAGTLDDYGRTIYRVVGEARIRSSDGSLSVIETGSATDTSRAEFRLDGHTRSVGRELSRVFIGAPALQERRDGGWPVNVPTHNLRWKPDGPGMSWGPYGPESIGSGRLQYVEAGSVRHSVRLRIMPRGALIRIEPGVDERTGSLHFIGFGAVGISVANQDGVLPTVNTDSRGVCVSFRASLSVPDNVYLTIDWGSRGRMQLKMPFPTTRVTFGQPDGAPLPFGSRVAVGALAGVRAEAVVPIDAQFDVHARYAPGIGVVNESHHKLIARGLDDLGGGYHSLDLAVMQPAVEEWLDLGGDPDATVRFQLHSNQANAPAPSMLLVQRFDLHLEKLTTDPAMVALDEQSRLQAHPGDVEVLELETLSLLDPGDAVPLERVASCMWRFPHEMVGPGPYLILGRQGGWYRVHPMPYFVTNSDARTKLERRPACLGDLYAGGFRRRGDLAPYLSVCRKLRTDPDHSDWPALYAYLQYTTLPIDTFGLLRALSRSSGTAALAAVIASATNFPLLWDRMEKLPFAWFQIPLTAWRAAYEAYSSHLKTQLAVVDSVTADKLLEGEVDSRLDRVTNLLPGLGPAFGFIRSHVLHVSISKRAGSIVLPELQTHLAAEYARHRESCPALTMGLRDTPELPGLEAQVGRIQASMPWTRSVFVPRIGRFEVPQRADFGDAPALAAVLCVAGMRAPRRLETAIRDVRARAPEWFDEALTLAQMISFGCMKSAQRDTHVDN